MPNCAGGEACVGFPGEAPHPSGSQLDDGGRPSSHLTTERWQASEKGQFSQSSGNAGLEGGPGRGAESTRTCLPQEPCGTETRVFPVLLLMLTMFLVAKASSLMQRLCYVCRAGLRTQLFQMELKHK